MDSKLTRWMGVGMVLFGFALGLTTGLSSASGISTTLVTSLFTFVGGALLTYSGFRKKTKAPGKKEEEEKEVPRVDLPVVGKALTCVVAGLLVGLLLGISGRVSWEIYRDKILMNVYGEEYLGMVVPSGGEKGTGKDGGKKTSDTKAINLLQSQEMTCNNIGKNLKASAYDCTQGGRVDAVRDLQTVMESFCQ